MARPTVVKLIATMKLSPADKIAREVFRMGREAEAQPLAVAVLDSGGNLVVLKREDGCGIVRNDIAIGKAWGALGMGNSSRKLRDSLADRPAFQSALAAVSQGRFVPVPGGVLVMNAAGVCIGAVGVSGDSSECDEALAIMAIKTVGFACDPQEPDPAWNK